jgi:transposase-like protein
MAVRRKDLNNTRDKARRDYLKGRPPIQALVEELRESDNWISSVRSSPERKVTSLLFAHSSQVQLYHTCYRVLLIDCIYKTNRYNMPLLHFVGTTPIGKYFSIAFCFLSGEKEDDYEWAINQFGNKVLPTVEGLLTGPEVIITDNDTALKTVLKRAFPETPQLLCLWHINKNVLTHAQKAWVREGWLSEDQKEEVEGDRRNFMAVWAKVRFRF